MAEIREGTEIGHEAAWGYVLAAPHDGDFWIDNRFDDEGFRVAYAIQQEAAEDAAINGGDWTVCALIPVALLDPARAIDKDSDALDEITGGAA